MTAEEFLRLAPLGLVVRSHEAYLYHNPGHAHYDDSCSGENYRGITIDPNYRYLSVQYLDAPEMSQSLYGAYSAFLNSEPVEIIRSPVIKFTTKTPL
jgi:hypothetical protein